MTTIQLKRMQGNCSFYTEKNYCLFTLNLAIKILPMKREDKQCQRIYSIMLKKHNLFLFMQKSSQTRYSCEAKARKFGHDLTATHHFFGVCFSSFAFKYQNLLITAIKIIEEQNIQAFTVHISYYLPFRHCLA